jgi:phosphate-selective porin OprO/OprP
MKLTKLSLAMAAVLGTGVATDAMALDLYVDTKTQQIFAEPGPGRTKLGSFEKVEDQAEQKAEIAKIKEDLALKNNELKALDEHINDPAEGKLQINDKGIKFESKDGNFEMGINGRIQVDSMTNVSGSSSVANATGANTTNQLADGAGIRRARIGIEGSYYKDFLYKFEYDFARGNGSVASSLTDSYIAWNGYKPLSIKVGQFKEPFSLEEATSNRYLTFIERNMAVNTFSDNDNAYKVGLGLSYAQPRWTAALALQTESVGSGGASSSTSSINTMGNTNRHNGSGDTGWGVTGRVTALPWFEDNTKFLHVGLSGSERQIDNNYLAGACGGASPQPSCLASGGISFGANIDTNVDRTFILNTGNLSNSAGTRKAQRIARFGGETALVYGPFSAQAEYIQANVSGRGYNDEMLNGYYGYASYFLTGESRAYKASTGAWDRIKPKQNFNTHGGLGAWEVAAGYDYLNLIDGNINGGRATTGKVGLNWYPNSHIRLMANFIHALNIDTKGMAARSAAYNSANFDVVEMRAQVDW